MNKYEEALDTIKGVYEYEALVKYPTKTIATTCKKECATLQELVSRATPMKVIRVDLSKDDRCIYDYCPNESCHQDLSIVEGKANFCPKCGQALDWEGK